VLPSITTSSLFEDCKPLILFVFSGKKRGYQVYRKRGRGVGKWLCTGDAGA